MSQRGRCFPDGPFTHPLNHQDPQSHLHWPLGSSSTVKPLTLSPGLLCFQARLNVSHSEFLDVGEQILYGCSWITVKNCQGKYDQVDSFSDIHFLFFWSSVSYLWHLSTFLCFPWVSFCVKWRDWVCCFQTCCLGPFGGLAGPSGRGQESEQCWLPEGGGTSSLRLEVNQGLRVKRSENHEAASLLTRQCGVIGPASQSPLPFPNITLEAFLPSTRQSALCVRHCTKLWAFSSKQNRPGPIPVELRDELGWLGLDMQMKM